MSRGSSPGAEGEDMRESATRTTSGPLSPAESARARAGLLEWTRRGVFAREWDLTGAGAVVATLRYLSILPQVIEVVSPAGRWLAVRRWTGIELTREGRVGPDLRYRPGMVLARITRGAGGELRWKRNAAWGGAWSITDPEGAPLLHVERSRSLTSPSGGRIEIEDAGRRAPDLDALVYLGWILAIRRRHGH